MESNDQPLMDQFDTGCEKESDLLPYPKYAPPAMQLTGDDINSEATDFDYLCYSLYNNIPLDIIMERLALSKEHIINIKELLIKKGVLEKMSKNFLKEKGGTI